MRTKRAVREKPEQKLGGAFQEFHCLFPPSDTDKEARKVSGAKTLAVDEAGTAG